MKTNHSGESRNNRTHAPSRDSQDDSRRAATIPPARAAAPGAPASGIVFHRETQEFRSPIATPQGTWIASTPRGGFEVLDRAQYVSLMTPRIPQPPVSHCPPPVTGSTWGSEQPEDGSASHQWLLMEPVSIPVPSQRSVDRAAPAAEVIDEASTAPAAEVDSEADANSAAEGAADESGVSQGQAERRRQAARERNRELVADPIYPDRLISRRALRNRSDLVQDPQRPGQFITRTALQQRQARVDDPLNPGQRVTPAALARRADVVEDPQQPGRMITREALRQRARRAAQAQSAASRQRP